MRIQTQPRDVRPAHMGAVHEALAKHGSDVAAMGLLWLLPVLAFLVALIRP